MKYSLQNNPILTTYQVKILQEFFATDFAKPFFLTGGTALSAFYLAHRESKDLDFFNLEDFDTKRLDLVIGEIANKLGCMVSVKVKSSTYNEIYLENKTDGWIQRLDFVREQPKRFGELSEIEGVKVDSVENIGSNKIAAILGRLDIKDYVDLYMIVHETEWGFDKLFPLAKQKDLSLNEFTLASCMADLRQMNVWPAMKVELDKNKLYQYYEELVVELLKRAKPQEK